MIKVFPYPPGGWKLKKITDYSHMREALNLCFGGFFLRDNMGAFCLYVVTYIINFPMLQFETGATFSGFLRFLRFNLFACVATDRST